MTRIARDQDEARSRASFTARIAGRAVRGSLPLTGHVVIAEPIEHSAALLAACATRVSTGSPALDRLLGAHLPGRGSLPGDHLPVPAAGLGPGRMADRRPPAGQGNRA